MCSYMCASPAYSGRCVNEPLRTSISTVASGTPWFSSDDHLESVPEHPALMILLELGALRRAAGEAVSDGKHESVQPARTGPDWADGRVKMSRTL